MLVDKIKYMQGYVRVQLHGYAPERFLNLCSNHNILIWDLEYKEEHYEFCISVKAFRQLKPLLRKTKTRLKIRQRYGLPFFLHRYRKRKLFFGGIALCGIALYLMSLFIWNIEIQGNLHRTDSAILDLLEENGVGHGIRKRTLDCTELEELLRSEYEDVIWASAKIQGTRLIIDIQENLATNMEAEKSNSSEEPSDLVAQKAGEIHSILTRAGTPLVTKGSVVEEGQILVEGKLAIYDDNGEIKSYQYCQADADILAITTYTYQDSFSMKYQAKLTTGEERTAYHLRIFGSWIRLPGRKLPFSSYDSVTTEYPLRLGENFYLPFVLCREVSSEYQLEEKKYTKDQAETLARDKLEQFCEKLQQKGVQIIENNVMIVAEQNVCTAVGELRVIESLGQRQPTAIIELQEGQKENESDGIEH